MRLRHLLLFLSLGILLTASECIPVGDDDDASDDDDATANDDDTTDDDDSVEPVLTTVSGEVIAIDRDTGLVLAASVYAARAGGMIVYALADGSDLSEIYGKATMDGPGDFEIVLEDVTGPYDLVVVADEDDNHFIENSDVARAYAFNPVSGDIEDATLVIDLAPRPGGGGGCGDRDAISGTVVLDGIPDGAIGISTNNATLTAGPWTKTTLGGAGPYAIDECVSRGSTAVLGYLDADANGYFEPSDPLGGAAANPIQLGLGDVSGITITIPDDTVSPPAPPAYVPLTGTVTYDAFTTGDILVHASHVTTDGYLFSTVTLAAPGAFALLAPANTAQVLVWAVLDEDGDGEADASVDPSDAAGPLNSEVGVPGIDLELGPAATGSISGTIDYAGTVGAGDVLHIAVLATDNYAPSSGSPVAFLTVTGPTFPESFSFAGLPSATYWVGAYLDLGGDDEFGPGAEDPDHQIGPVLLAPGGSSTDNDFTLLDP